MPPRLRDSQLARVVAFAMAGGYAVLGLLVLAPEGIYSVDIGVKFVQARALAASDFASLDLPYPGEFLDPAREFFPIRPPFVMQVGGETQSIFTSAAAVLQAGFAAVAGLQGLVLLSLLSAAVILLCSAAIAPAGLETAVVLAVGLASPLWSYAVLGWEHAPAVALSTAAFAVALRSGRTANVASGLLLGAAALLREEVLLLAPGLLLLVGIRGRAIRSAASAAGALAAALLCWAAVDALWFGRPVAAHLRHAVELVDGGDAAIVHAEIPSLERLTLREKYETVVQYWLLGYGKDAWIIGFAAALAVVLLVRLVRPGQVACVLLLTWTAAVAGLALADLWEVATAPKWLAGLHRVSPFLVFAILPPPHSQRERAPWYSSVLVITVVVYVFGALVATNTTGGKSLGPRLLLPLFPLLAVVAMERMVAYLRAGAGMDRVIRGVGVVLVASGILSHALGTVPAYYHRNKDDAAVVQVARKHPARIIVADDPLTAQLFFPLYYRKIIFLADSHDLRARLGTRLVEAGAPDVLLVSRQPEPGMRLSPMRIRESDRVGRIYVQHWGRAGRALE